MAAEQNLMWTITKQPQKQQMLPDLYKECLEHTAPALKQPMFFWKATEKYQELQKFEIEVKKKHFHD